MEILGSAASMAGGSAATGSSRYSFRSSSDMGTDAQKYEKVLLSGIISPRKRSANWRTLSLERSSWAGIAGLAFILAAPPESCYARTPGPCATIRRNTPKMRAQTHLRHNGGKYLSGAPPLAAIYAHDRACRLFNPQRRGAGPVPADSHRSQTRNSYHDSLLLVGSALR